MCIKNRARVFKSKVRKRATGKSPPDRRFEQNSQTLLWGGHLKFLGAPPWYALWTSHQTLVSVLWEETQRRSVCGLSSRCFFVKKLIIRAFFAFMKSRLMKVRTVNKITRPNLALSFSLTPVSFFFILFFFLFFWKKLNSKNVYNY